MKNLILIGSYGSGKTQLAINFAMEWVNVYDSYKITLIDLDVVNPYFRSRELANKLEKMGINMVLPQKDFMLSEAPALSPAISGKIKDKSSKVILDVGGDPAGATVLGRFYKDFQLVENEIWMVINTYRPDTANYEQILKTAAKLEETSRLKITGFINNTNLGLETTPELVVEGLECIKKASEISNIPVIMTTVYKGLFLDTAKLLPQEKVVPLEIFLRPDW
jgi:hypothetical protein